MGAYKPMFANSMAIPIDEVAKQLAAQGFQVYQEGTKLVLKMRSDIVKNMILEKIDPKIKPLAEVEAGDITVKIDLTRMFQMLSMFAPMQGK